MAWAPDYVTLAAMKGYRRIADTVDDTELSVIITAASRAIDTHCNRQFGRVAAPELRMYTARPDYERGAWVVDIDDLDDATGLAVSIGGVAVTSYTLEPVNAVVKGLAWTRLVIGTAGAVQPTGADNEVSGTAMWGWTTTPVAVTHAARLQSSRFVSRRDSPYGVAGSPEQGSEMRLLARVDPDVGVSLRHYVRRRKVG
jgi:hypothetical protein